MVVIDPINRCLICTDCGELAELRAKAADAVVIAQQLHERRHKCTSERDHTAKVASSEPTLTDRWRELFKDI